MKRWIHAATTSDIPLGSYATRNEDRRANDYYWQLRSQDSDDLQDIMYFANSPDRWDRYNVCLNPNTPEEILEKLTHDPDKYVQKAAQTQLNSWKETGEPYWGKDSAKHRGTPFDYRTYVQEDNGNIHLDHDYYDSISKANQANIEQKSKTKSSRWPGYSFWNSLAEIEDNDEFFNSFNDAQEDYLLNTISNVENKLGIFSEPSGYGHNGSIEFSSGSSENRFEPFSVDIEELDMDVFDLARSSRSKKEFGTKYEKYLLDLINQHN